MFPTLLVLFMLIDWGRDIDPASELAMVSDGNRFIIFTLFFLSCFSKSHSIHWVFLLYSSYVKSAKFIHQIRPQHAQSPLELVSPLRVWAWPCQSKYSVACVQITPQHQASLILIKSINKKIIELQMNLNILKSIPRPPQAIDRPKCGTTFLDVGSTQPKTVRKTTVQEGCENLKCHSISGCH